jgi:hypothetical protein
MTTQSSQQVSQAVKLIGQHKDSIKSTLGTTSTGTSFDPSRQSYSDDERRRLMDQVPGLTSEQVDMIFSVWPIYQLGYSDGQSNS